MAKQSRSLSVKQRLFVEKYLRSFNATAAAVAAGYSEKSARAIGHENLTKPDIAAEIERRLRAAAMSADEALARLAEQARGEQARYIDAEGRLDIAGLRRDGKAHLIKALRPTAHGLVIEFHDAQGALDKILRAAGAYVDRHEIGGKDGKDVVIRVVYGDGGTGRQSD